MKTQKEKTTASLSKPVGKRGEVSGGDTRLKSPSFPAWTIHTMERRKPTKGIVMESVQGNKTGEL